MDDFYKLSAKMKDLFPSDPAADKQALLQMANERLHNRKCTSTTRINAVRH